MTHQHPNPLEDFPQTLELIRFIGRVEAKLDHHIAWIEKHEQSYQALLNRVSALEQARMWLLGLAAGVAGAVSIGYQYLMPFLRGGNH